MDRLPRGDFPPGGHRDLKTLAAEAGVTRTGFYPRKDHDGTVREGPHQHLAREFERRLKILREARTVVDPGVAQIERLKAENAALKARIALREALDELAAFKRPALSRLAAQYVEITHLRDSQPEPGPTPLQPVHRHQPRDPLGSHN
jgi:hypothetical protein